MNKTEFVKELSSKSNVTQKECKEILKEIKNLISETLKNGEEISLIGFGKFEAKVRKERTFFNPKTKKSINMPKTIVPSFKAGKSLKTAMYI